MNNENTTEMRMTPVNLLKNSDLNLFIQYFSKVSSDFNSEAFLNLCEDTNEETVLKILAHFNENLKDGIRQIQAAAKSQDCENIWKAAHKIAGSAELLGFKFYADSSRDISRQIRANPVFEAHEKAVYAYLSATMDLEREVTRLCPSLPTYL